MCLILACAAAQRFRTTGASVELEIKYTNTVNERAAAGNHKNVKATITAIVQTGAWSSVGAQVYYDVYPNVPADYPENSTVKEYNPPRSPPPPPAHPPGHVDCQPAASPLHPTRAHADARCPCTRWSLSSRYKQGIMVSIKSTFITRTRNRNRTRTRTRTLTRTLTR